MSLISRRAGARCSAAQPASRQRGSAPPERTHLVRAEQSDTVVSGECGSLVSSKAGQSTTWPDALCATQQPSDAHGGARRAAPGHAEIKAAVQQDDPHALWQLILRCAMLPDSLLPSVLTHVHRTAGALCVLQGLCNAAHGCHLVPLPERIALDSFQARMYTMRSSSVVRVCLCGLLACYLVPLHTA